MRDGMQELQAEGTNKRHELTGVAVCSENYKPLNMDLEVDVERGEARKSGRNQDLVGQTRERTLS